MTILLALWSASAISQTAEIERLTKELDAAKTDSSRMRLLQDIAWEYSQTDPEKGIAPLEQSIVLAKKLKDSLGLKTAYRFFAEIYTKAIKYETAKEYQYKALKILPNEPLSSGKAHHGLAILLVREGVYGKAAFHYYQALELFEKIDFKYGIGRTIRDISVLHSHQRNYQKSLEKALESLKIFEELGSAQDAIAAYILIGGAYEGLNEFEKSRKAYENGLEIAEATNDMPNKSAVLDGLGSLHIKMKDFDKALDYLQQALVLDSSNKSNFNLTIAYGNIAALYFAKGDSKLAHEYTKKSYAFAEKSGTLHLLLTATEYAAESHHQNGQYDMARQYMLMHNRLEDSIYSAEQSAQILEITKKYETEKKEQEIERLLSEREIAESKAFLQKTLLVVLSVLLVLLIVITILLFRMRKAREQKKLNDLENKALRAQMNPHFIFNCLNSIQRLYVEGKEELANDYMADFSSLLRRILENSSMEKISLKEEIRSTTLYLDLEKMRTDNSFEYAFEIDPAIDQINRFVPPLIFQPYVENAIWHGIIPKKEKGKILIKIGQNSKNELECEISDNGVGFSKDTSKTKKNSSKGMSITEKRLGGQKAIEVIELDKGGIQIKLKIKP